jgi:hypothetical protein
MAQLRRQRLAPQPAAVAAALTCDAHWAAGNTLPGGPMCVRTPLRGLLPPASPVPGPEPYATPVHVFT